jgi:hypothetical protein
VFDSREGQSNLPSLQRPFCLWIPRSLLISELKRDNYSETKRLERRANWELPSIAVVTNCGTLTPGGTLRTDCEFAKTILVMAENTTKKKS